jgi:cathepsin B
VNNHVNATWTAGHNKYFKGTTLRYAKSLCGTLRGGPRLPAKRYLPTVQDIPASFDSRTKWSSICPSTAEVRDQAACGSCWAFGAVEAMTDRTCIASNGKNKPHLSAQDMLCCCNSCGMGCNGGYPSAAWDYWVNEGLVSGGNYHGGLCYPYSLKPCDHHVNGTHGPCGPIQPTPQCTSQCENGADWMNDKHFGQSSYQLNSVTDIQNDILKYGPVEAAFDVFEDFLTYKSGVYSHMQGSFLGGHAIKILGWGTLGGTDYWTVANSWNEDWGNKGYFLIKRGSDECGIEDGVVAGLPK